MAIRLTENRLRRIIKESIRKKLTEALSDNGISVSNEELIQRIKNGEHLKNVFDKVGGSNGPCFIVGKDRKYNILNELDCYFLSPSWFKHVGPFHQNCDYNAVEFENGKYNLINNRNGYLVLNQGFDWIDDVSFEDYWVVINNHKYNFINDNGELLSPNQWFDYADNFRNGYAQVVLNNKRYQIDKNGKIINK